MGEARGEARAPSHRLGHDPAAGARIAPLLGEIRAGWWLAHTHYEDFNPL